MLGSVCDWTTDVTLCCARHLTTSFTRNFRVVKRCESMLWGHTARFSKHYSSLHRLWRRDLFVFKFYGVFIAARLYICHMARYNNGEWRNLSVIHNIIWIFRSLSKISEPPWWENGYFLFQSRTIRFLQFHSTAIRVLSTLSTKCRYRRNAYFILNVIFIRKTS